MPEPTARNGTHRLSIAALVGIAVAIVFWTVYASLSQYNLDTYGDMVENYAWGTLWQWGYPKHPPFFAWVTAAWFSIFPASDWAYYLLSATNVGVTLVIGLFIARRFLTPHQQLAAVCLAQFLPPLGFLALKYNANSAMLPVWNAAFLFYTRLLERRRIGDAVLLGVMCGLAVLAKYMSATLILSLILFTVFDEEARSLLWTPVVWVAATVAAMTVAPHIVWLAHHHFVTISYAAGQGDGSLASAVGSIGGYAGAVAAYALLPLLVLLAVRKRRAEPLPVGLGQIRGLEFTATGRAFLAYCAGPFVLTLCLGVAARAILSSPWAIPYFAPLPFLVALLIPASLARATSRRVAAAAAWTAIVVLAASPFIQSRAVARSRGYSALPLREVSRETARLFEEETGASLQVVGGLPVVANGTVFYAGATYAIPMGDWDQAPAADRTLVRRYGAAHICLEDDDECIRAGRGFLERVEFSRTLDINGPAGGGQQRLWRFKVLGRRPST